MKIFSTNEFLEKTWDPVPGNVHHWRRPKAIMQDGYSVSIQASETHYCRPRTTKGSGFTSVELGYPTAKDPLIDDYAEDKDSDDYLHMVYPYVPVSVVDELIKKHGGIVACSTIIRLRTEL